MSTFTLLLHAAVAETQRVLGPAVDGDWAVPAGDVSWSCHRTAAHIADDLFSYASQVITRPADRYLPIEAVIDETAAPDDVLQAVGMCAELLGLAVSTAPGAVRAWHPNGVSDPDGFAAMGSVEVLVHTHDIARGLGLEWAPPADLSALVLTRLFPNAPAGDPSSVLLWCTGRAPLPGRLRLEEWSWDSSVRR